MVGTGGARDGAGRKPVYEVGTVWVSLPVPADYAEAVVGRDAGRMEMRAYVVAKLRSLAARAGVTWNGGR